MESAHDGDLNTYWHKGFRNEGTGGGGDIRMAVIYTLASPRTLEDIIVRAHVQSAIDRTTDRLQQGDIALYFMTLGGIFEVVPGSFRNYGPTGGSEGRSIELDENFANLHLENVTAVKLEAHFNAFANNGRSNGTALGDVFLNELQVASIPEPISFHLFLVGCLAIGAATVRRSLMRRRCI